MLQNFSIPPVSIKFNAYKTCLCTWTGLSLNCTKQTRDPSPHNHQGQCCLLQALDGVMQDKQTFQILFEVVIHLCEKECSNYEMYSFIRNPRTFDRSFKCLWSNICNSLTTISHREAVIYVIILYTIFTIVIHE